MGPPLNELGSRGPAASVTQGASAHETLRLSERDCRSKAVNQVNSRRTPKMKPKPSLTPKRCHCVCAGCLL